MRSTVPDATGATYSTNGVDCFAEFSMTGFRDDGSGDFVRPTDSGRSAIRSPFSLDLNVFQDEHGVVDQDIK